MGTYLGKFIAAFKDPILRKRLFFVGMMLVVFRLLATIPIPGIDTEALARLFANNQLLGLFNVFSGGGLTNLSIVMIGLSPYITASIIMQLVTMMSPKIKAMYHEEGEAGRRKFTQWSRFLSIPLALIQAFGFLTILERSNVIPNLPFFELLINVIVITAGSMLLVWLGELITEFGIGNGTSLIIFAGIVASFPSVLGQFVYLFEPSQIPLYLGFLLATILVIWGVVLITEAERPIPVTYAKQVRGGKVLGGASTYLPLRLNQSGVIPIIFALSILVIPQMIVGFLTNVDNTIVRVISDFIAGILANQWLYASIYFVLVFVFTFFYTAVTFEPDSIATNLQKSGAFIPGVRPGQSTSEYVAKVLMRITLVGALFLSVIAVLPLVMQGITGNQTLAIGGTALLIVVSVVLDLIKKIDAQVSMREY